MKDPRQGRQENCGNCRFSLQVHMHYGTNLQCRFERPQAYSNGTSVYWKWPVVNDLPESWCKDWKLEPRSDHS